MKIDYEKDLEEDIAERRARNSSNSTGNRRVQ